jgi:hypothetical protein
VKKAPRAAVREILRMHADPTGARETKHGTEMGTPRKKATVSSLRSLQVLRRPESAGIREVIPILRTG